jgi:two-component system LytT family response regulator
MFSAIIIEDEMPARVTIKSYLKRYFDNINIISEFETIADSLIYLEKHSPDIIFLDVQLKDGKGIEILSKIDPSRFRIIFTTAFDSYTLEAFKHKAFGYLIKPIDPLDFKEIITRVINDLSNDETSTTKRRIKLPTGQGYLWVLISEIIRCEAKSNYTLIYLSIQNKPVIVSKTLKFVENELINSESFIRVHQSHLVNKKYISKNAIISNNILLSTGDLIPVSRSKKNDLF